MNYKTNIAFAWFWMLMGVISGMTLGLFAFNGPITLSPEMMEYTSLPRRMLRLAHIAFFGLGFLNWMYGMTVPALKISSSKRTSILLILGAITMSPFLMVSAFYEPFKYSLVFPALCIFWALSEIFLSILRRDKKAR